MEELYKTVITTCPYCGCGCSMMLEVVDGSLRGLYPSKTGPVNQGKLCIKGWRAHEFVVSPQRLAHPYIRKNDVLEQVEWDEALDVAVGRLSDIKERYGADSIGFFASAKCTNEENYLLQKFARAAVGTNNVDHCARL